MTTDMNRGGGGGGGGGGAGTPSLLHQTRKKNPLVYNGLIRPDFF